jgi:hypothetical protein
MLLALCYEFSYKMTVKRKGLEIIINSYLKNRRKKTSEILQQSMKLNKELIDKKGGLAGSWFSEVLQV